MVEKILAKSVRLMFVGGVAFAAMSQAAMAQEAAPETQKVEITGSAIKKIDSETAVPVTVLKIDDLRKQGITTVEQVLSQLSAMQTTTTTSQSVGNNNGGASFANLRGLGQNKTLVLLNGRRLANNAIDGSAPDLNMIPFAAIDRVEVLRDGASSLYGSDAIGGVINFITKKTYNGFNASAGLDAPQHPGGKGNNASFGVGVGDLDTDRYNFSAFVSHQQTDHIGGTDRPYNTRYSGGVSSSTSPANYYQGGSSFNPAAPACTGSTGLFAVAGGSCKLSTSSFVDYTPDTERTTGLFRGTFKINEDHQFSLEYLNSQDRVNNQIAPVPYGGLYMNNVTASGAPNPYYPVNAALSSTYTEDGTPAGVLPGFIHVKWRDLPNGPRQSDNTNYQQRLVANLTGTIGAWDYDAALTYNQNKVRADIAGYSNGNTISQGVLNGIINPFGAQSAAGAALLQSAALNGNLQNAKDTVKGFDAHASRELGDWFSTGRPAALAIGGNIQREDAVSAANTSFAEEVVASTGLDPNFLSQGSRTSSALFGELNIPVLKTLDVTAALRFDKFSDFGNTTNPKVSFRYQPTKEVLVRGSYSTGFRAPSLYELNAAQTYGNTNGSYNDPVNCPGGTPLPGKPAAANCGQQFEALSGGNKALQPEKAKNLTLGLVVEPVTNLTLSVDLWAIQLRNTIGTLPEQDIFLTPNLFPGVYHRTASGNLATDGSQCPAPATCGYIDLRNQNLGGTNTNGVDLSALYKLRNTASGNYVFSLNSTYVNKFEYQNYANGPWIQNVGVYSGAAPIFRWQHSATVNWTLNKFGAGLSANYKSGYTDQTPTNWVPSYTTFDTYGSYEFGKGFSVTAGVRNLFDRDPPLSYQTTVFQAGYDPRFTDPTGRAYYVRASYNY